MTEQLVPSAPWGLPPATVFYLSLYLVTLVLHVLFMNYVVGGVVLVVADAFAGERWKTRHAALTRIVADWLPSMLSGAITAGIAPLLFVQILYQENFYTANLLLSHRWMAILPVLIAGSYGLYLRKSDWFKRAGAGMQSLIALIPFAAVIFTGYSWTENHLLSLRTLEEWVRFSNSTSLFYYTPAVPLRFLVWFFGAFPVAAVCMGWQLSMYGEDLTSAARTLAGFALLGLFFAAVAGGLYGWSSANVVETLSSPLSLPAVMLTCAGIATQVVAWGWVFARSSLTFAQRTMASTGALVTIVAVSVCREGLRLNALGAERLTRLFAHHQEAAAKEGIAVFAVMCCAVLILISWVFALVRRSRAAEI